MEAKKNKRVTLREMTERGEVDTAILDGWIRGTKVTITAVLTNTAVYYNEGRADRKFVETLELIEVNEADVKLLPVRESFMGAKAREAAAKKAAK